MKKLISRLALFAALFLILSYAIDFLISNWVKEVRILTSENELWEDIYDKNIDAECYIYGSSRAKTHIDPLLIEDNAKVSSYNFGNSGQSFNVIHLQHKKIIQEIGYPKYIIMSMDPATLCRASEIFNERQFIPYMLWDAEYIKHLAGYRGFTTTDFFVPLFRYHTRLNFVVAGIKEYIKPSNTPRDRVKGYKNDSEGKKPWVPQVDKMEESIDQYPVPMVDDEILKLFELFIQECKDNKVSLAFVYTPINSLALDIMKNKKINYNDYIREIAEKHNLPLLDYTQDSICYNKDYFSDSVHLKKEGSEMITKKMTDDLIRIGFFK